jgi:hypothetical protein
VDRYARTEPDAPEREAVIKSDEIALTRLHLADPTNTGTERPFRWKYEIVGMHEKRSAAIYQKWVDRGWADFGVSLRTLWLTPTGIEALSARVADYDARAVPTP